MISSPPIIEYYTGMTRPDLLNIHCASIRMKIEITFYNAQRPLADNGEQSSIRVKCDNLRTCPILTIILLDGISKWLKGGTLSQYRCELRYHQLIQEQNDIGWRHIVNGRLPLQWSELQGRDYLFEINNKQKKHLSGRTLRTSAIIQEVWRHWQVVWT
jgi:hypothetical protein